MRIYLTGATGFIGSHIVPELTAAGHQVLGLARSDAGARWLAATGAEVQRGDIEDLASLRRGAAGCDGVIHTAFDHDFAHFVANCEKDARVIAALGDALADGGGGAPGRPLVITSSTAMGAMAPGQYATEDAFNPHSPNPRVASELAGRALSQRGVNVSVVRLSQIHNRHRQGLVTEMIRLARDKGFVAYVGEGLNQWSAAHVSDTALLYRLAVEKGAPGARYHATTQSGIEFRRIAQAVGHRLGLPAVSIGLQEVAAHFGWLAGFAGKDMMATSVLTQQRLGWDPTGPDLMEDLAALDMAAAA